MHRFQITYPVLHISKTPPFYDVNGSLFGINSLYQTLVPQKARIPARLFVEI
ncbi:hypothetical protein TRIP_C20706 [Candidatus Zixiibacteriota bacterium]|nr:hypothetical protein TRIP_C20706 [candidate division Zixibacteria bacterium]